MRSCVAVRQDVSTGCVMLGWMCLLRRSGIRLGLLMLGLGKFCCTPTALVSWFMLHLAVG